MNQLVQVLVAVSVPEMVQEKVPVMEHPSARKTEREWVLVMEPRMAPTLVPRLELHWANMMAPVLVPGTELKKEHDLASKMERVSVPK